MKRIAPLLLLLLLSACGSGSSPQGVIIGKPYQISGQTYKPKYNPYYDEIGIASWYGPGFHGGKTANGERYDQDDMTAAHKTLPLPSIVRVTNLDNGRSAVVRINDRGPFVANRIIDLSRAAAVKLGVYKTGTAKVRVEFLDEETRDYVSKMPNGKKSLLALDKARQLDTQEMAGVEVAAPAAQTEASLPQAQASEASNENIFSVVDNTANSTETAPIFATPQQQSMENKYHYAPDIQAREATPRMEYFIQAGTFGMKGNADRLLLKLKNIGNARVMETVSNGKKYYRVLSGPYASGVDAAQMLSKLSDIGVSGARVIKG